jgi:mannose-6-phosphate isomerase-like protein (cupin superfamily)
MTPEVGTALENPKSGSRTVFLATAESTAGGYVEVEATYAGHGAKPPLHLHPSQREDFTVLSGELTVVRGDETFTVRAGDSFSTEPGTPHQMWSDGDEGAVLRWRTTPALRTGEMFCAMWELARDNDWSPTPLQSWEVVSQYADEFCLC